MRKAYTLVVFLLLSGAGKAQMYNPGLGFGIVAPPEGGREEAPDGTISVARLRHRLVGKAVAAFSRATKFAKTGAWQMGARELEKAVELDPEFSEAHGNLGANYIRLGRLQDASRELRRAIQLDPASAVHHANLSIALLMVNRERDAEMEARTAVGLDPNNFRAHYLLGVLLYRQNDQRAAAMPHLEYAARFLPEAQLMLADVYRVNGDVERAEQQLNRYHTARVKSDSVRSKRSAFRSGMR